MLYANAHALICMYNTYFYIRNISVSVTCREGGKVVDEISRLTIVVVVIIVIVIIFSIHQSLMCPSHLLLVSIFVSQTTLA